MPNEAINHYDILGVTQSASKEEIKKAFLTLSRKYHPDANDDANAATLFRLINEAYQTLHDDARRAAYDRGGAAPQDAYAPPEPAYAEYAADGGQAYSHAAEDLDRYDQPPAGKRRNPLLVLPKLLLKAVLGILYVVVAFVSKVLLFLGSLVSIVGWLMFGLCVIMGLVAVFQADYGMLLPLGVGAFGGFVLAYAALPFLALLEVIKEFLKDKILFW